MKMKKRNYIFSEYVRPENTVYVVLLGNARQRRIALRKAKRTYTVNDKTLQVVAERV